MADFYIGQGDTASTLQVTLRDSAGNAVPYTGGSVHIDVTPIHGGAKIVDAAATATNPAAGVVSYTFTAPQTATPGDYLATFTVTFSGGAVESFPNAGYYHIKINEDAPTVAQEYASVEELKDFIGVGSQTTYADAAIKLALQAASASINNLCDRVFTLGTTETRVYYPIDPRYVLIEDAATVTTVTTTSATLVLGTDYYLDPVRQTRPNPPYSVIRSLSVPGTYGPFGYGFLSGSPVSVTGTFGWPSVPAPVKMATVVLGARFLQRRQAPMGVVSFGDSGEAARISKTDPDVAAMLEPYTRYVRE